MLREASERNSQTRQAARNDALRKQYPYQTGAYKATPRRAHTVHEAEPSSHSHSRSPTYNQHRQRHPAGTSAIRNPFEGSERESYIVHPATEPSNYDLRVGMVPALSHVPKPMYTSAQGRAERRWERAMPDIAVTPPSSARPKTGLSHRQPHPEHSYGRGRTHTIHRSRSSEAPEVYDPIREALEASLPPRRTYTRRRGDRPVQPVGVCPPGWI